MNLGTWTELNLGLRLKNSMSVQWWFGLLRWWRKWKARH